MIGVVCGFQAEIDCFERASNRLGLDRQNYRILPSGSSAKRAQEAACSLLDDGAEKLLSFGIAGALSPRLRVGDVAFSTHVVTLLDESYGKRPKSRKINALTFTSNKSVIISTVCGVDEIAFTPDVKRKVHAASRADLADMESHGVARAAHSFDVPFFILRAISDGINDSLPAYVANGVDEKGKPRLVPILKGLLRNPATLNQLLRLKKNTETALAALEEAAVQNLPKIF